MGMMIVSESAVLQSMSAENPWWTDGRQPREDKLPRRGFYNVFWSQVKKRRLNRSVVLLGPRRVGKTVMALQAAADWMKGRDPVGVLYLSLDAPAYARASLSDLLAVYAKNIAPPGSPDPELVIFDEVQFMRDWEVELKRLTDRRPEMRIIATGSAASALAKASRESGAGRFSDFLLPPLLFNEYLTLVGLDGLISRDLDAPVALFAASEEIRVESVAKLNTAFVRYLNFGGFPEVARSDLKGSELSRFVKSDILDKAILRDLPQLYGITDIQELYHLFSVLAFRTGSESSLEGLSQASKVAKPTIKKYIEYLEAAFLLSRLERIDQNARRFQRAPAFKVHLLNASLRAALFAPLEPDDEMFGSLVESAVYANLWPRTAASDIHYARWDAGEIDFVGLDPATQKPVWACEVKWSDRHWERTEEIAAVLDFAARKPTVENVVLTTRTRAGRRVIRGVAAPFVPASALCWLLGDKATKGAGSAMQPELI